MKLKEYLDEMARADVKGAEEAIKNGDWDEAAEIYIKNAKERGFDEKKIRSGLGSTFRFPADQETIKAGSVELNKEDSAAFKKAIQKQLGKTSPTKKQKKEKKTEEQVKKDTGDFVKNMEKSEPKSELVKKSMKESILGDI